MFSYLLHKSIVKIKVVVNAKPKPQHLFGFQQMADIGTGMVFTYFAVTVIVDGI